MSTHSTHKDGQTLLPVDKHFLLHLRSGAHLFHYPRQGDAETSFQKSPSAEYTLYSVIDVPTGNEVILARSFDKTEVRKSYTREELLAGEWWYNPDVHRRK